MCMQIEQSAPEVEIEGRQQLMVRRDVGRTRAWNVCSLSLVSQAPEVAFCGAAAIKKHRVVAQLTSVLHPPLH